VSDALPGIDPDAVAGWLGALGLGATPPIAFSRIGAGKSNILYLATDATGARWVLRRPPLGPILPSAHDVAREHRILSGLDGTAVPIAAPLGLTTDPAITDAPLLALAHVDGVALDGPADAEARDPAWRRAAGLGLVRALGTIHAVDLDATGLTDLAKHTPYGPRQLARWRRQWAGSALREQPLVDEVADRLEARVPPQREVTLVHGDYHLRNVLFDPADGSVRAVLDWELCTLGDPLADLGGLLAYWPRPGDPAPGPNPTSMVDGFPERDELADAYWAATGRGLDDLPFWHALACWKVAIIIEGVRARGQRRGNAEAPPAAMVDDLLARARLIAADA